MRHEDDCEDAAGGGTYGLKGYEYQVDISVWLAVEMVLVRKDADSVVLEPLSQEDLEADLVDTDPGRSASEFKAAQRILVVQAKTRSRDPWDYKAIQKLLRHGGASRVSARDRLADRAIHYLLMTDGALVGVACDLRMRKLGVWPNAADMPKSIAADLPTGAAGRVAVMDGRDAQGIGIAVREILTGAFRVPRPNWEACFATLRDEARARMTGYAPKKWRRKELEQVVMRFGGYFASSPQIDRYIRPTNWSAICERLVKNHAVVLIGGSGTGKTMTSEALWDFAAGRNPGLSRVHVPGDPSPIRSTPETVPTFFDVQDPWGKFSVQPGAAEWGQTLPGFLRNATEDRLFVVTTRSDILSNQETRQLISKWAIPLDAEHYGKDERTKIYNRRLSRLAGDVRDVAHAERRRVIGELDTLLEIDTYFDFIEAQEPGERPQAIVNSAIDWARAKNIPRNIEAQIEAHEWTVWCIALWGLLKAAPKVSRTEVVPQIEDQMSAVDAIYDSGLEIVLNFFVAGRNLRQDGTVISYNHPKVEQGFEAVVRKERLKSNRILGHLARALVSLDSEDDHWGAEACANLVAAAKGIKELRFASPKDAQAKVDAWLESRLDDADEDLEKFLRLAAKAGSTSSALSELARFLLNRKSGKGNWSWRSWEPLTDEASWYADVGSDKRTKPLLTRFIRTLLPFGRPADYPEVFADHIFRLAGDVSADFLYAAEIILDRGATPNDDCIVAGAQRDKAGFEGLAKRALDYLRDGFDTDRWSEISLDIENGVYSEDHAEHLAERAGEEAMSAEAIVEAYVRGLRLAQGWTALAEHPSAPQLARYWLQLLRRDAEAELPSDEDELLAAADLLIGAGDEDTLWSLAQRFWSPRLMQRLLARLLQGSPRERVRRAAASCLRVNAIGEIDDLLDLLVQSHNTARLVGLLDDLTAGVPIKRWTDFSRVVLRALRPLSQAHRELLTPFAEAPENRVWAVSAAAAALASSMAPLDEEGHLMRLRYGRDNGFDVAADVAWLLSNAENSENAAEAVRAADAVGLDGVIPACLTNKYAIAQAEAVKALTRRNGGRVPPEMYPLASHKSRFVRQALLDVIAFQPQVEHVPVLLELVEDTWSSWSVHHEQTMKFPIARKAGEVLVQIDEVPATFSEQLIAAAKDAQDFSVCVDLLRAAIRSGTPAVQTAVVQAAVAPGREGFREAAAAAAAMSNDCLSPLARAELKHDDLLSAPVGVAATLTLFAGQHTDSRWVEAAAEAISASEARKVYLLLLADTCDDATVRAYIRHLLPLDHPARAMLGDDEIQVPRGAIADLGGPDEVAEVWRLLHKRFIAEPKRSRQRKGHGDILDAHAIR